MRPLSGRISDRLRKLFPGTASEWSPPRPAEGAGPGHVRPAVPGHVEGHGLGDRTRGQHRTAEPQRYRVAAWLVAVGALLIAGCLLLAVMWVLAQGAQKVSERNSTRVTPSPMVWPCRDGGLPPCLTS